MHVWFVHTGRDLHQSVVVELHSDCASMCLYMHGVHSSTVNVHMVKLPVTSGLMVWLQDSLALAVD